jgi:hypothetical protein
MDPLLEDLLEGSADASIIRATAPIAFVLGEGGRDKREIP